MAVRRAYAIRPYTGDLKNGVFSIHSTTGVAVYGAYAIHPYTNDLKNGYFSVHPTTGVVVCEAYAIRPYPTGRKFIGVEVRFYPGNEIIVIFSGTRVGRNSIRPTNGHANGQMDGKMDGVLVRFYPGNEIIVIFSGTRVGRNSIRPTNGHANGQMDGKMDGVLVRFYTGKGKMAGDSMNRHPRKGVWGCSIVVVRFLDHMPGLHFEITIDDIDG